MNPIVRVLYALDIVVAKALLHEYTISATAGEARIAHKLWGRAL